MLGVLALATTVGRVHQGTVRTTVPVGRKIEKLDSHFSKEESVLRGTSYFFYTQFLGCTSVGDM